MSKYCRRKTTLENSKQSYLYLVILALIWGSSFKLMKEGLETFNNFQVAAMRISIAGLFLLPFIRWKNVKIKKGDLKYFVLSGVLGNGIPAFLFTAAQTRISSSLAGALNALTPLFTLAIGILFLGVKLEKNKLTGVIIGLIGALLLVFHTGLDFQASQPEYTFLVVLAAIFYGINVNLIKHRLSNYPPLLVASLPLGIISIGGLVILSFTGFPSASVEPDFWKSTFAIIILAVVGTALSLVMFNELIQQTNAVFASSVTYLIPVVAMVWGIIDKESISLNQLLGMGLILLAIRVINYRRKQKLSIT